MKSSRWLKSRSGRRSLSHPRLEWLEDRITLSVTVTNLLDDGSAGTLRSAILQANATGDDQIVFDPGLTGTITLNGSELLIAGSLTITGPGADQLAVSGNHASRVFEIANGASASLSGLTIRDGMTSGNGGGILGAGPLTLSNCILDGNSAGTDGGGIYTNRIYYIGLGGSILAATLSNTTLTHNTAGNDGGGIYGAGWLIIGNSTLAANTAGNDGGGSWGSGAIFNSTLTLNAAGADGGGMYLTLNAGNDGVMSIDNSGVLANVTITANGCNSRSSAGTGGGIWGSSRMNNSIVAGNFNGPAPGTAADDISGSVGGADDLIGTGGSGGLLDRSVDPLNNNQVGIADPGLGPLSDNGGPTLTIPLLAGSPAIASGSKALAGSLWLHGFTLTTDQRGPGYPRTYQDTIDIGAFESQLAPPRVTFSVTNTNDTGPGSLRQYVQENNLLGGGNTIAFALPAGSLISLSSGELQVFQDLTISGPGADQLAVSGNSTSRVFGFYSVVYSYGSYQSGGTSSLSGLTIENGYAGDFPGGGVYEDTGIRSVLAISACVFSNNFAASGGALANSGVSATLNVSGTSFSDNHAGSGGAIYNRNGRLSIAGSTLTGNSADFGGGIYNGRGTVSVSETSFTGNSCAFQGGGFYSSDGGLIHVSDSSFAGNSSGGDGGALASVALQGNTIILTNSTFAGNTCTGNGGALYLSMGFSIARLNNVTIADNVANVGGGIFAAPTTPRPDGLPGTVSASFPQLGNTIVAGNSAVSSPDLFGTINSRGYNLVGDADGAQIVGLPDIGDQLGTAESPIDPLLGALGYYGGPTQTMPLLPGSPALDKGLNTLAVTLPPLTSLTTDQRGAGFDRVINGTVDIGAFEDPSPVPLYPALASAEATPAGTTISGTFRVGTPDGAAFQPNTTFTFDFYADQSRDPLGVHHGQTFLGQYQATTDSQGNASFTVTDLGATSPGQWITATATDPNGNIALLAGIQETTVVLSDGSSLVLAPESDDPTLTDLTVTGGTNTNVIGVSPGVSPGSVVVSINGQGALTFAPTGQIVINHANAGVTNQVTVTGLLPVSLSDVGGAGTDSLTLDDRADPDAVSGVITDVTIDWASAPTITYGDLASLTIESGSSSPGNSIDVQATSAADTTLVLGPRDAVTAEPNAGPIDVHVPGEFDGSILGPYAQFGTIQIDGALTGSAVIKVGTLGSLTVDGTMSGLLRGFGAGTNDSPTIGVATVTGNFDGTISAVVGAALGVVNLEGVVNSGQILEDDPSNDLQSLNVPNGSFSGMIAVASAGSITVGGDLSGTLSATATLGSVTVAGAISGSISAPTIASVAAGSIAVGGSVLASQSLGVLKVRGLSLGSVTAPNLSVLTTSGAGIYGGSGTLTATLTLQSGSSLPGQSVVFSLTNGVGTAIVGTATTGANGVATLTGVDLTGLNAGLDHRVITARFAGASGNLPSTSQGDLDIGKATLLVSTTPSHKTYGDGDPVFSALFAGFAAGDGFANLGGKLQFTTTEPTSGHTPVGTYAITPSGLSSTNYNITYLSGTLSVAARALTITASDRAKTFGDTVTFAGAEFAASGVVFGDTVTKVTLTSTGAAATAVVGAYSITASAAVGSGLGNYAISYIGGTLTITTHAGSIYVLDPSVSGALSMSGNASLKIIGDLVVDSNSSSAISASGNTVVVAATVQDMGGVSTGGNAKVTTPQGKPGATGDPFGGLVAPLAVEPALSVNLSGNATQTINPGTYRSIKVSGNAVLTLNPGNYVVAGGGISVSGNAGILGAGVSIYNAGSNVLGAGTPIYGGIGLSGNGLVKLSAPLAGSYAGVLFFQSRDNTRALSLSGNAALGISGMIYAPKALLSLSGNAQLLSHVPMVVDQLQLSGNGSSSLSTDGSGTAAGELLAGDLFLYIDDPSGSLDANARARIDDAIAHLDDLLTTFGVTITLTSDATTANLVLDTGTTSAAGGYSEGVLGCYTTTGEITLIRGWNWYTGSAAAAIGADQFDLETIVSHELGHALGLGHSGDSTSPMFAALATHEARRYLTTSDLGIRDAGGVADALHAALPSVGTVAANANAGQAAGGVNASAAMVDAVSFRLNRFGPVPSAPGSSKPFPRIAPNSAAMQARGRLNVPAGRTIPSVGSTLLAPRMVTKPSRGAGIDHGRLIDSRCSTPARESLPPTDPASLDD